MERLHHTDVHIEGTTGGVGGEGITLPEFETLCDYAEEAIHDGLESSDVAAYLERMGFDVSGYDPLSRKMGHREHVGPDEAREIRLEYGRMLERDVRDLRRA
jgi:hypothetical protein